MTFWSTRFAASYVDPQQLSELELLGVTDSKKIDDERIRKIGPLLIHHFVGIYYTVDNPKFNQLIKDGYNMNKMKAMLHNQALQRLRSKKPGTYPAYIDQFCTPEKFAAYLNVKMIENAILRPRPESLYRRVALPPHRRYVFLVKWMNSCQITYFSFRCRQARNELHRLLKKNTV